MTKQTPKCVVCGKRAMGENLLQLPSCSQHFVLPTKTPKCPDCEALMIIKKGKERTFWSCPTYPHCFGTRNLLHPDEEMNVL